ncbi:MAG: alpha-E domain-containing protein [Desulfobacteraceae bacterium]|jgi:uncharacterized alpha-E superfamily protein
MLSRVADALYWMARYLERAENISRYIDVNWHLGLDQPKNGCEDWSALVQVTGDTAPFLERYNSYTEEYVTFFLMFDTDYPHSVISCLRAARENARSVREIISADLWEQINAFYHLVESAGRNPKGVSVNPNEFCNQIRLRGMTINGVYDDTMNHGEGWHFSRLGRFLERADKTSRILDVKYFILLPDARPVGTAYDDVQWGALLRATGGLNAYRQIYGRIAPANVGEFLLFARRFPRSVLFSLTAALNSLNAINGTPAGTYQDKAEQLLGKLCAEISYMDISTVFKSGLHQFTDQLQIDINHVNDAVSQIFFGYGFDAEQKQVQEEVAREE